jgi:[acyl-carrier-protein] S-malonyltransferase
MTGPEPGLAFVFPGQGSQYPGMGVELRQCAPAARALVPAATELTGLPIDELMTRADARTIADPEIAQLLVFVLSSALARELREHGLTPFLVAGHSLGEFTALVACQSLDWEVGLELVAARGRAMAAAARRRPGTMAAIAGLPASRVRDLCVTASTADAFAVVANVNSPRQTVVSGTVGAVESVCSGASAAGALRARRLPVGGAYHSPLMADAELVLRPLLAATALEPPRTALVSSVTGQPVDDVELYRPKLLGQITSPVQWQSTVETLVAAGVSRYVEVGPGRVLAGLGREMARTARHLATMDALRLTVRPHDSVPSALSPGSGLG